MIRPTPALFILPLSILGAAVLVGCASNDKVIVGGVPEWIADGAKLSSEPAPRKPDAAVPHFPSESGPIEFTVITDKRTYPAPPRASTARRSEPDPLERNREARIRRLVR
jgi:hypothetical protein